MFKETAKVSLKKRLQREGISGWDFHTENDIDRKKAETIVPG